MGDSSFMVFLDEPTALSEFSNEVPDGKGACDARDRMVLNDLHGTSIHVVRLLTKVTVSFLDLVVSIDECLTNFFTNFLRV